MNLINLKKQINEIKITLNILNEVNVTDIHLLIGDFKSKYFLNLF